MLLRAVISLIFIVGFVGCGEIEYKNDNINGEIQNSQTDDNSAENTDISKTGKQLYVSLCMGCHGEQGEKEALSKSQLIGGQAYTTTKYQLEEYKAGRLNQYLMGEIMKQQAQELTSNEILLVSKYIETLSLNNNVSANTTSTTTPIASTFTTTTSTIVKKDIFTKCKGCHGAKGEISALDKSKIIQNMNKLEIYNALIGYQNGTYGREMKGLMKGQVNGMSKTELKNLARYIDAL